MIQRDRGSENLVTTVDLRLFPWRLNQFTCLTIPTAATTLNSLRLFIWRLDRFTCLTIPILRCLIKYLKLGQVSHHIPVLRHRHLLAPFNHQWTGIVRLSWMGRVPWTSQLRISAIHNTISTPTMMSPYPWNMQEVGLPITIHLILLSPWRQTRTRLTQTTYAQILSIQTMTFPNPWNIQLTNLQTITLFALPFQWKSTLCLLKDT